MKKLTVASAVVWALVLLVGWVLLVPDYTPSSSCTS